MDPIESKTLINVAGGDKAFAELLNLTDQPGYQQRVNNWKRRGIPAAVLLRHQQTIRALQRKRG